MDERALLVCVDTSNSITKCTNIRTKNSISKRASKSGTNRTNITTSHQLKYLATSFAKVADNISKFGGQDTLRKDIDMYTVDDDLLNDDYENITYEEYWDKVGKLKEGDWYRYEVLPRFARALGTIFNYNSETERAFSVQSDIHRDTKRNLMYRLPLTDPFWC